MILLDTHVLAWAVEETASLRGSVAAAIRAHEGRKEVLVSAVSFWEVGVLAAKDRLQISNPPLELRALLLDSGMVELPLAGDVAILAAGFGLHGDPADRFIAATAISHEATLVTADERLLTWKHAVKRQDARR